MKQDQMSGITNNLFLSVTDGALAGLVGGLIYSNYLVVWVLSDGFRLRLFVFDLETSSRVLTAFLGLNLIGCVIGVAPAIVIGGLSGVVFGFVLSFFQKKISPVIGALSGALLALIPTAIAVAYFWPRPVREPFQYFQNPNAPYITFLIYAGPLVILYVLSGAWGGWKYAERVLRSTKVKSEVERG